MKDLLLVDPKTGSSMNCGVITKKRQVGEILVYLTYDESSRMWWIVWHDEGPHHVGFIEARREACWETFFEMTPADLAKLRTPCS
jgi:hypothetical protein